MQGRFEIKHAVWWLSVLHDKRPVQYLLQQLIISLSNFEIKKIFLELILGKKPVLSVGFKSAGDIKNKVIKVHVTGVQMV